MWYVLPNMSIDDYLPRTYTGITEELLNELKKKEPEGDAVSWVQYEPGAPDWVNEYKSEDVNGGLEIRRIGDPHGFIICRNGLELTKWV